MSCKQEFKQNLWSKKDHKICEQKFWTKLVKKKNCEQKILTSVTFPDGWVGGIGNKAQLRPPKAGPGAWHELGKILKIIIPKRQTVMLCNYWSVMNLSLSALIKCSWYRVSHNTVYTFVFWISWLPIGIEIPSWTFFNSPFRVDFENIHFFIIQWNLDRDIGKILWGDHIKS